MNKQLINVEMPRSFLERLDNKARELGTSRSALIKIYCEQGLKN